MKRRWPENGGSIYTRVGGGERDVERERGGERRGGGEERGRRRRRRWTGATRSRPVRESGREKREEEEEREEGEREPGPGRKKKKKEKPGSAGLIR